MDLDEAAVLRLGGWDARFTRVVFVAQAGDYAVALLDADSDYTIDDFERDELGVWRAGGASGSANDDTMTGMSGETAYAYGRAAAGTEVTVDYLDGTYVVTADGNGWWAFVGVYDHDRGEVPRARRP